MRHSQPKSNYTLRCVSIVPNTPIIMFESDNSKAKKRIFLKGKIKIHFVRRTGLLNGPLPVEL